MTTQPYADCRAGCGRLAKKRRIKLKGGGERIVWSPWCGPCGLRLKRYGAPTAKSLSMIAVKKAALVAETFPGRNTSENCHRKGKH